MKISQFQLGLLIVFGLSAVGGLLAFATYQSSSGVSTQTVTLQVWGTMPFQVMNSFFGTLQSDKQSPPYIISYKEKPFETFERDLVEAIADGVGPDMVFIPDALVVSLAKRIVPVPMEAVSERYFLDTYAQAAETFWGPAGAFGIPVAVDPMVFYWNRDHLQSAGISRPPTQWSAIPGLAERLTLKDRTFEISRSTIAMGEYANVTNAREILATFLLQSGSRIMTYVDKPKSTIMDDLDGAVAGLSYFVQFSNPTYPLYSWNRSLPASQDAFIADMLTFYPGFASEIDIIRSKNPNLNFDLTVMPQPLAAPIKTTLARSYGFAVLKTSPKAIDALTIMLSHFIKPEFSNTLADFLRVAPVRRDTLSIIPTDAYGAVLFESAVMGRSWADPDPEGSAQVFKRMIENSISGARDLDEAVRRADKELTSLAPTSLY